MYGDPNIGKYKLVRVKVHIYLSMNLYYNAKVEVKIDRQKYVKNMIDSFPINIEKSQSVASPETENIFKVDLMNPLNNNKAGLFHTTVTRSLFLCKRSRPDIQPTIVVLCTRVEQPNQVDCNKLLILMKYIVVTQKF